MALEEYKKHIRTFFEKIPDIDYVFLFGSVLKRLRPDSDIDILISGQLTIDQQLTLPVELGNIFKRKVDLVVIEEASNELIMEAIPHGLPILINDKEKLKRDYLKNFYLYQDGMFLRKLRLEKIKRSFLGG